MSGEPYDRPSDGRRPDLPRLDVSSHLDPDSPAKYADDSNLASAAGDVVTTMWLPMRDMGLGDAGTDVGMLQEAFGLPATGVYDKNTSRKIAQWQAANSLPRSGYFGAASREVFARSAQMQMRRVVVTSETYGAGGPDARALTPRGSRAPSTNVRATIGVSSSAVNASPPGSQGVASLLGWSLGVTAIAAGAMKLREGAKKQRAGKTDLGYYAQRRAAASGAAVAPRVPMPRDGIDGADEYTNQNQIGYDFNKRFTDQTPKRRPDAAVARSSSQHTPIRGDYSTFGHTADRRARTGGGGPGLVSEDVRVGPEPSRARTLDSSGLVGFASDWGEKLAGMSAGLIEKSRIDKLVRSYAGNSSGKGVTKQKRVENNVVKASVASPPAEEVEVEEVEEVEEEKPPVDPETQTKREMAARTMELQRAALERERIAREERQAAAAPQQIQEEIVAEEVVQEEIAVEEVVEENVAEETQETKEETREEDPMTTKSDAEFEAMAALEAAAQAAADLQSVAKDENLDEEEKAFLAAEAADAAMAIMNEAREVVKEQSDIEHLETFQRELEEREAARRREQVNRYNEKRELEQKHARRVEREKREEAQHKIKEERERKERTGRVGHAKFADEDADFAQRVRAASVDTEAMNKKAEMTAEEKKEMDFAARVKAAMEQAQATPDFKFGTDDDDNQNTESEEGEETDEKAEAESKAEKEPEPEPENEVKASAVEENVEKQKEEPEEPMEEPEETMDEPEETMEEPEETVAVADDENEDTFDADSCEDGELTLECLGMPDEEFADDDFFSRVEAAAREAEEMDLAERIERGEAIPTTPTPTSAEDEEDADGDEKALAALEAEREWKEEEARQRKERKREEDEVWAAAAKAKQTEIAAQMEKAAEAEKEWEQMMAAGQDETNASVAEVSKKPEGPTPETAAFAARDIIAPPPAMPPGLNDTDVEVNEEAVRAYFADEEKRKAEPEAKKGNEEEPEAESEKEEKAEPKKVEEPKKVDDAPPKKKKGGKFSAMLDDDAVETDWKNRNKPSPTQGTKKEPEKTSPDETPEPKETKKETPKSDLDVAQANVAQKKAKLAELRGEPIVPEETSEETEDREQAVSALVGDAINNVVDKLNVEALSDCDDDDYTDSEECANVFDTPADTEKKEEAEPAEKEKKEEAKAEGKKAEVKASELPPLPPIGTEERTYSLFGADPNAPREPEPKVEPEPEGGWPASALLKPDEHELMTPGAGMGHAMDSSEIHPEDAGDHFFDSRVAQQLAKAKEISADASFDEDDDDDLDFDERVARALEEADYRQRPLDSPDDADYMQSQVDQQLAEEGERAKDVWREDADHVGWETLDALDGTEREPWFVNPDEHELGTVWDKTALAALSERYGRGYLGEGVDPRFGVAAGWNWKNGGLKPSDAKLAVIAAYRGLEHIKPPPFDFDENDEEIARLQRERAWEKENPNQAALGVVPLHPGPPDTGPPSPVNESFDADDVRTHMAPPAKGKFGKAPEPPELYYQPTSAQLNEDQSDETEAPEGSQETLLPAKEAPKSIVEAMQKKKEAPVKNGSVSAKAAEAVPFPDEDAVGTGAKKSSFSPPAAQPKPPEVKKEEPKKEEAAPKPKKKGKWGALMED